MRLSRLLALLLIVVALGAFIYFFERHQTTTDLRRELQDKVFPGLEQDDIERVSLRNSAGRFDLVRQEGEWFLSAPVEDRADSGAVSGLSWSLATLRAERVLEEELDLSAYGLQDPELEVTVWTRDGRERRLSFGDLMPLGHSRAVTTGDGRVALVGGAIAGDLQRGLAGWRSTELARVWEADVAAVSIQEHGSSVQLVRSQGVWSLTAPISDIADRERAQGLLSDLSGARIREFVDDPPPPAELGLDAPTVELTITRREDAPAIRLAFGRERTVDGELQVACRRGEQILWVDGSAVKRLSGSPDHWRSPRLLPFESWAAEFLEVESGGVSVALRRDGFRWLADGVEVDGERVRDWLNALSRMMVRGFSPQPALGEPLGRVVVVTSDEATLVASFVVVGDQAAAEVAGRSGTLLVDAEAVQGLFEDPLSLTFPLVPESSKEPGG